MSSTTSATPREIAQYSDRDLLQMAALMMRALRNGTMRPDELNGNTTLEAIWQRAAITGCDLAYDGARDGTDLVLPKRARRVSLDPAKIAAARASHEAVKAMFGRGGAA